MDLLFIELMLHLLYVKQINSQPILNELILSLQITRGRVHFKGDSTSESPCWHRVTNLQPFDPDLLCFAAVPSLQYLAIFMAPHDQVSFVP